MPLTLQLIPGAFAVCRLPATAPVPPWAGSAVFSSVTRTADELSIMCPTAQVPAGVKHEAGWRLLKFAGPFDFGTVGILASVVAPLAAATISSLAVATFDTDYLLVKADRLEAVVQALTAAGHTVHGDGIMPGRRWSPDRERVERSAGKRRPCRDQPCGFLR